ncbi:hypothetical protein T4D_11006 [Trichinella pseudospiralis]|uniref:Uncharacterized protein n=1 Tax=Trichinella pseudospiralis TaxID=6337 RepID=A0A0V1FCH8_TRIPS|nr:hypothetical protein T4D_11006 [Trichinella pseudospiralis]
MLTHIKKLPANWTDKYHVSTAMLFTMNNWDCLHSDPGSASGICMQMFPEMIVNWNNFNLLHCQRRNE